MEITLHAITFDCAEADALARFWSALLQLPLDDTASTAFATIGMSGDSRSPQLLFVRVPEGKQVKNRVHLDLVADDFAGAVDRAVELGATRLAEHTEDGYRWCTLTDPEGNEFDIVLAA